jgi:hypothetical protein
VERGATDEAGRRLHGERAAQKRLWIHPEDALEGRGVDRAGVRRVDLVAVEELGQAGVIPQKPRKDWPVANTTVAQP